jgi:hypothetical protein
MTNRPRKPDEPDKKPLNVWGFTLPKRIDSTEWIDWPAYHASCDERDKPTLRVIKGGKDD